MRVSHLAESHDGHFGFCPATSQVYHVVVKAPASGHRLRRSRPWQMAADQLIDGRRPEDGTDFFSYAAGASPHVTQCDCRGLVVAGHADHAGARADRSRRQADVRIVCAVSRFPEPAFADYTY